MIWSINPFLQSETQKILFRSGVKSFLEYYLEHVTCLNGSSEVVNLADVLYADKVDAHCTEITVIK